MDRSFACSADDDVAVVGLAESLRHLAFASRARLSQSLVIVHRIGSTFLSACESSTKTKQEHKTIQLWFPYGSGSSLQVWEGQAAEREAVRASIIRSL